MNRNRSIVWLATTALSLSAFSFAAGFGIRNLAEVASSGRGRAANSSILLNGTKLASTAPGVADPDLRPAELYKDVYDKLHRFYVEPLPGPTKLAEGSIEQMLASLDDPNTRLIGAREWEAISQMSSGTLRGLGAVVTVRNYKEGEGAVQRTERDITVVAPLPGSAAEKAGLLPGDRIQYLDGKWIAPFHLSYRELGNLEDDLGQQDGPPPQQDDPRLNNPDREAARERVRQEARRWLNSTELHDALETLMAGRNGEHELTVVRTGEAKPLKIKVTLADGQATLFSSRKLNPTTGYIQLGILRQETPSEVARTLAGFQKEGVTNLVVDLRRSPGGSLDAARDVIAMLAPGSTAYVSKERDASRKLVDRKIAAKPGATRFKATAISVLIDKGTAGSSETIAAALKDNLGAKLVGSQSFGDGTEQHIVPLANGAAASITHAQILSPKGAEIEGKGLKPDVPGGAGDVGIEAAIKALASGSKPGTAAAGRS